MDIVDGERKVYFKPVPFSNKSIIGGFAVAKFEDGGMQVEMMSLEELENTRKHSKASNSMAWKDFTNEMYRKTHIRRLCKKIEIDFENAEQKFVYDEETAIETDPIEIMKSTVTENANTVDFVEAEVKPVVEVDDPNLPDFLKNEEM